MTHNYKIYHDTSDAPISYKGGSILPGLPEDWVFGPGADWNHRPCLNCSGTMRIASCPDEKYGCCVFHGWYCETCHGNVVDDEAFTKSMSREDFEPKDMGFYYCPYIPLTDK